MRQTTWIRWVAAVATIGSASYVAYAMGRAPSNERPASQQGEESSPSGSERSTFEGNVSAPSTPADAQREGDLPVRPQTGVGQSTSGASSTFGANAEGNFNRNISGNAEISPASPDSSSNRAFGANSSSIE